MSRCIDCQGKVPTPKRGPTRQRCEFCRDWERTMRRVWKLVEAAEGDELRPVRVSRAQALRVRSDLWRVAAVLGNTLRRARRTTPAGVLGVDV